MVHDLDPIRFPGSRQQPDDIARLEGLKADSIRIGKFISDVLPGTQGFPLIRHRMENSRAAFYQIVQDCDRLLEMARTYGGEP